MGVVFVQCMLPWTAMVLCAAVSMGQLPSSTYLPCLNYQCSVCYAARGFMPVSWGGLILGSKVACIHRW